MLTSKSSRRLAWLPAIALAQAAAVAGDEGRRERVDALVLGDDVAGPSAHDLVCDRSTSASVASRSGPISAWAAWQAAARSA